MQDKHKNFLKHSLSSEELMVFDQAYAIIKKDDQSFCCKLQDLDSKDLPYLKGIVPAVNNHNFFNGDFCSRFNVHQPIMSGSMSNGIASAELVISMANHGLLASYGTAGLSEERITSGIQAIQKAIGTKPFACCLIHQPALLELEMKVVQIFLSHQVHVIEASAFMSITPAIILYKACGVCEENGRVINKHKIIAKISRPDIAEKFLQPAELAMVKELVEQGLISKLQANWVCQNPICDAITVEADSGGHTDKRPAQVILPEIICLRDHVCQTNQYATKPLIGQAGGIGNPMAILAANSLGAEYVVTGSINQATIEAGTSDAAKDMLANCAYTDVGMAPAADMFEHGVEVQVLRKGNLFVPKANFLQEVYKVYDSLDVVPPVILNRMQNWIFKKSLDGVWQDVVSYHQAQQLDHILEQANKRPKFKMALIFKWYLGQSTSWAITEYAGRSADYQISCGPAMGGFNAWVANSNFKQWQNRSAGEINQQLFAGALFNFRKACAKRAGMEFAAECRYPFANQ